MSQSMPSTSMTHVNCESKLRSGTGNWVAIGCTVVYYARTAQALVAGISCQHCSLSIGRVKESSADRLQGEIEVIVKLLDYDSDILCLNELHSREK